MAIAGIDYSYTSPGIVILKGKDFKPENCEFFSYSKHNIKDFKNFHFTQIPEYKNDMERFKNIADWSINILKTYKVTHVGLEDYAKRALGPVFTIGENTGILKYRIQTELNIPIRLIAPTVIKKFAHGKGSGGKEPMYAAWESDTKIDLKGLLQPKRKLDSPTTDIVDAYFIAGFLNSELYTINKV